MSNEIEIGEYGRTKKGFIGKIVARHGGYGLHYELDLKKEIQDNFMNGIVREDNIVKHSKNIIDLIEEGDYVNGKLIHKTDIRKDSAYIYYGNCKTFTDYQIKTILTHEQYEQNCYKVKE